MEEEKIQTNNKEHSNEKLVILDLYGTCLLCPSNFSLIKDIIGEIAVALSEYPDKKPEKVYKEIRNVLEKNPVDLEKPIILKDGNDIITIKLSQDIIKRIQEHVASVLLYDDVLEGIEYLKSKGCKIAGASNLHEMYEAPLKDKNLIPEGTFDHMCVSYKIGHRKPEPEIFEYLNDISGIDPNNTIVIGDRFDCDIQGAYNAGIEKRILLVRPSDNEENDDKIEHHEKDGISYMKISNLKEATLKKLLEIIL